MKPCLQTRLPTIKSCVDLYLLIPNFYCKIMNNYKGGNIGIKARSMGNLSSHNMNISWPPRTLDITFHN